MKIRTGFVTNSSSSSFTLSLQIDRKSGKPLVWGGFAYCEDDGNFSRLEATLSPKKLAHSTDTAALAEALKEGIEAEACDEMVKVLDDEAKFIKEVKKLHGMEDITRISVQGIENYGGDEEWDQYFEYDCEKKRYICRFRGEDLVNIDGSSGGFLRVPDEDEAENVKFVMEHVVLQYCGREKEVVIPAGTTKIGKRAFAGCPSLERVTVPEGVEVIDKEAFYNCCIRRIDLPASVKQIDKSAFSGCDKQLTIYAPADSYAQSYAKKNRIKFEAKEK